MIRRHVAPGVAVPLHPEAAAFADHYGFTIDVLAAYRPTGKGRVERQVNIVRDHVLAGRSFDSIAELDGAFAAWLPIRRGQVHRTHGQVIAVRAEADRAALRTAAGAAVSGRREASAAGRQGLPGLLRGQLLLRARPPGPARQRVQLQIRSTRPAETRSASTPSPPTAAGGSPAIPGRPAAAPGWSTRRTGTGCPTATPAPPPSKPPRLHGPAGLTSSSRWRRCWPAGTPT